MTEEEIVTDAKDGLAHVKSVIAGVDAEVPKVKAFWQDYKFYLVAFVILVIGMVAGYHLHK